MKRPVLILSHLTLAVLGACLALYGRRDVAPPAAAVPVTPPASPVKKDDPELPPLPAKVAMAGPAAWRAAWDQTLLAPRSEKGELQMPDPAGFFTDWCEADPDGAIRGLAETYAPGYASGILFSAVDRHGAIMAPALVKHYRELKLEPGYQVEGAMGRSINALSKENPTQASGLLATLPSGVRASIYGEVFERQDRANLDLIYKALPAASTPEEALRRNQAYASAVEVTDPEHGVWNGIAEAGDSALRKAFATEGFSKARQSENWSGFVDAVERLDPAARDDVREAIQANMPSGSSSERTRSAISEECRRRGLDDRTLLP